MTNRQLLCVVMDGVGESSNDFGNAYLNAYTPHLDWLKKNALYQPIYAHGTHVGLPSDNDIGNSEVGHNAIGAGQVYDQGAKLVQNSVDDGSLFNGAVWKEICQRLVSNKKTLHLLGLLSDGNVHSHIDHLIALMENAVKCGLSRMRLHLLMDGRDVGEKSCELYVEKLLTKIEQLKGSCDIAVASGGGRMTTTMDRYEADWSMVERGWKAHVLGESENRFPDLQTAVKTFREDESLTDQYFPSFVIECDGKPVGEIIDGDAVIFFNFRGDRSIEISRAFTEKDLKAFDRKRVPDVYYAGMMEYDGDLHIPKKYLVSPPAISNTLGEHIAALGLKQFACSETQKYGHVTYFWNGNKSGKYDEKLEEYLEIPSDVIEFNKKPWMKAYEICEAVSDRMRLGQFDFGRVNFANGDMVGHTGDYQAALSAMVTVDMMIGRLIKEADKSGTILMITADHGNCDEMFDAKQSEYPDWQRLNPKHKPKPKTSHTKNQVPLFIYDPKGTNYKWKNVKNAGLGHLAATACQLLSVDAGSHFMPSLIEAK